MRINWVLSNSTKFDPLTDIEQLKTIGPFWGSVATWRHCLTDNVVCHDIGTAKEFVARGFQNRCNFYLPKSFFEMLDSPQNVKLYDGIFNMEVDNKENIVCMHLASANSDLVLLKDFSLSPVPDISDKLEKHKALNYRNLIKHVIANNPLVQWVLIDHNAELDKEFKKLSNLSVDSLDNVIKLLLGR